MKSQKPSQLKRLAIVALALAVIGVVFDNGLIQAAAVDQISPVQNQKDTAVPFVAQSSTPTATPKKTETPAENQRSESQTEEKEKSTEPRAKKLKDFRPSEQIEAEQAVDFPYDI
jgi:hypothetical protein